MEEIWRSPRTSRDFGRIGKPRGETPLKSATGGFDLLNETMVRALEVMVEILYSIQYPHLFKAGCELKQIK